MFHKPNLRLSGKTSRFDQINETLLTTKEKQNDIETTTAFNIRKIANNKTIDIIFNLGLTLDTKLYRATKKKFVDGEKMVAYANPNSCAIVSDIYSANNPEVIAKDLAAPSLNVNTSRENRYYYDYHSYKDKLFDPDMILIAINLSDVLKQNGKIYPDINDLGGDCYIVTIPEKTIRCEILSSKDDPGFKEDQKRIREMHAIKTAR